MVSLFILDFFIRKCAFPLLFDESQGFLFPIFLSDFLFTVDVYYRTLFYTLELLPTLHFYCDDFIVLLWIFVLICFSGDWLLVLLFQKAQIYVLKLVILRLLTSGSVWDHLARHFCFSAIQASVWWTYFSITVLGLPRKFLR